MSPLAVIQAARARFGGMWLLTAKVVFVAVAAVILLCYPHVALGATGFGGLLPLWAALAWIGGALVVCVFTLVALGTRRLEWASNGLLVLAILIALNGAVSIKVNGMGSVWAVGAGYTLGALALLDRSRALRRYGNFKLRLSDFQDGDR